MFALYLSVQGWFAARLKAAKDSERGASAVEYGLLVGLIAVAIIAVLVVLGPKLAGLFSDVSAELPADAPATPTT
jgi:pilus assembly protein Flp/PilA